MKNLEKTHFMLYNNAVYNIGGVAMDRITQSMMDAFKSDLNVGDIEPSELFEYFSNYCVVNSVYGLTDFDIDDITTGNATQGIDGIAIIVN